VCSAGDQLLSSALTERGAERRGRRYSVGLQELGATEPFVASVSTRST
jgi:hypothetical protein